MTVDAEFTVKYWGATGSLTRPLLPYEVTEKLVRAIQELAHQDAIDQLVGIAGDPNAVRQFIEDRLPFHLRSTYGGNTTCFEIQTSDALLIIDAGSGLRELGIELQRRFNAPDYTGSRSAHVLLTHAHMDHTYATPFCDAYFDQRNDFTIWAPQTVLDSLNAVLNPASNLMGLYFPPSLDTMSALRRFHTVAPGADIRIGDTRITTLALDHPGGCLAYRLDRNDRSLVFSSDHEHTDVPDLMLAEFARDADLLYMDAQYWRDEYEGRRGLRDEPPASRRGWGHSPFESCIPTALAAQVRHLHLGHHDPKHGDEELARIEAHAKHLMQDALSDAGRAADDCQVQSVYEGLVFVV